MNTPKLRFKEFTDEWKENKLHDIAKITMGQSPNSENYTYDSSDTLLIQGNADLYNGKVIPRLFTKQITKTCDKEDIIMTVRAPVGDIAISDYYACIGRGVCSIKSSKFIYHYLDYLKEKGYWKKISKGSTIDSITSDNIKSLIIKTPSKKELEKIIRTIDLINKKIELQTRKIKALKLFKKGLLDILINNMKIETITTLNKIGTYYSGLAGKSKEAFETGNQKYIPFMSVLKNKIIIDNLPNVLITENEHQNKVKSGDLFFTISSETQEEVGMCSTINCVEEDLYLNSFCFGYRLNNLNKIDNEFLCYLLLSRKYRNRISKLGQGFTRVNLSKNQLLNLNVELPKIEVQIRIKNILNTLNVLFDLEVSKLNTLNKQKKGLLQNMFV